jgi:uncharacterized membrane protein YkoI
MLLGAVLAMAMAFVIDGVAYTQTTTDDDGDDTVKGSVSAPDPAKMGKAAAERAALEAVPGTVHEMEPETNDGGYVVYDIEIAGSDGEVLYQEHEDDTDDPNAGERDDAGEMDD